MIKPGGDYFLRAEANAPGYEIELRVVETRALRRSADGRAAGDVRSSGSGGFLADKPASRGSVERRIRDTGNLMGTHCMSCHTQSGVWGPAVPIENGYRAENMQNFRRLINVMYESLRPTNYLKDAANNTSLAPLDIGDGPAGTRVAGHNVCTAERVVRAAQTPFDAGDPRGQSTFSRPPTRAASTLPGPDRTSASRWSTTTPARSCASPGIAHRIRAISPRSKRRPRRCSESRRVTATTCRTGSSSSNAFSRRITWRRTRRRDQFNRRCRPSAAGGSQSSLRNRHRTANRRSRLRRDFRLISCKSGDDAAKLLARIQEQLKKDEARLRAIQNTDGSWGFDPGKTSDEGQDLEDEWRIRSRADGPGSDRVPGSGLQRR